MTLALEPMLVYQQVVRLATDACLDQLMPAELDHVVKSARTNRSVTIYNQKYSGSNQV